MSANHVQAVAVDAATGGRRGAVAAGAGDGSAALTLDERGMICDCDRAGETLFKYRRSELVWRHVSMLLPQLTELELMQNGQVDPRLRFLCRIGRPFLAVTRDGERFASELFLSVLDRTGHGRMLLIVRQAEEAASDDGGQQATEDRQVLA